MLTALGGYHRNCSGLSRRRLLQAGGAGLFGLTLPKLLAAEEAARPLRPRAKSVIFLLLYGGPSQLETFDMKPDAPDTLRGPFKPIASRTPGLRICEHLPKLATSSDKFCVVRTVSHSYNDHSTAGHYIQTGHPWHIPIGAGFNATPKDWPSMGSIVEYMEQRRSGGASGVPNYAYLPNLLGHLQKFSTLLTRPGGYGGWLGRGYDPLATDIQKRDPDDNPFIRNCTDDELEYRIKGLASEGDVSLDRLDGRKSLLERFDDARRELDVAQPGSAQSTVAYDKFRNRALALVTSPRTRNALDVKQETAAVRDRYGRHLFGQSVLVARRLVEAGSRFVTVNWDTPSGYGWDSHISSNEQRDHLLPGLDQTLSALLADLHDRGLLDETLVVCCGEMGRTPKANAGWGRGHWSMLFPAVLAGAGVRGGAVYGRTDKNAAYADENPTSPEDLAATIFTALGIDPEQRIFDPQGRPVALVDNGKPLPIFG
ncbi:MAG: DUF1501 domain-containing protein [Planctomycetia bacterium]|nr:DUF1501 domain-containing protein [Planctomycetia bacterium]